MLDSKNPIYKQWLPEFRFWHLKARSIHTVVGIDYKEVPAAIRIEPDAEFILDDSFVRSTNQATIEEGVLSVYIDKKDKFDKKVYVGDIIRCTNFEQAFFTAPPPKLPITEEDILAFKKNVDEKIGPVCYGPFGNPGVLMDVGHCVPKDWSECVIIGNIYQDKHLIEKYGW